MKSLRNSPAFTLIELLIVISILGILATVVIVVLNPSTQINKANDAARKADLRQLQNGLEQYYSDNGEYPATDCTSTDSCWDALLDTNYLPQMPRDPAEKGTDCSQAATRGYSYYSADGTTYILTTHLDNATDPSIQSGAPNHYDSATDGGSCDAFNYKVVNQQ